jgi:alkaline phosphatase
LSIRKSLWLAIFAILGLNSVLHAEQLLVPEHQSSNSWYQSAQNTLAGKPLFEADKKAKNIILFVGDGMGVSTITAARILDGQNKGLAGEENRLSFESFPFTGLSKTYNVDAQTPDSAGTMTAMITGVKTDAGIISVDEDVKRGDCSTVNGNELVTGLELAEMAGQSTGFVTTTRVTHATPAATYAKAPERNWEDISDLPEAAVTAGCEDIALQLVNFENNLKQRFPDATNINGIEVMMGGGRRHFLPQKPASDNINEIGLFTGNRSDQRHLIDEWQAQYPGGHYIENQAGFDAVDPAKTNKLLALFEASHMRYEADRLNDEAGEPSLSEMTDKAIDILDNNEKGFFLLVEGGRIDHAHHAGNAFNALTDTIEFARAVEVALEKTNAEDTLIIVTADHSHVFTMAGYPKRGNPILGKVINIGEETPAHANDGKPYTTLGYANGLGFRDLGDETDADVAYNQPADSGRHDLSHVDTETSGYHQEALVPLGSETHGGEDVAIYAIGPGASAVSGVNEQNLIFHIMHRVANW